MRLNKYFINLGLVLIGLLLGSIITEYLSRYYLKKSNLGKKIAYFYSKSVSPSRYKKLSYIQYDPELGSYLKAGTEDVFISTDFTVTYSINSRGIRDKEIALEKPKGEFRVLAVGESTVFGEGVNYGKRFTEVIEESLHNVEVVNMGVQGFGLDQSFLFLKRGGFKFKPDAVIIFIFSPDYLERCLDIAALGCTSVKPQFVLSDDRNDLVLHDISYNRKECEKEVYPAQDGILGDSGTAED